MMDSLRDCDQPSLPVRTLKKGGPQTRHGKQNSKQNALKHGIFSKVVLLRDEPVGLPSNLDCQGLVF
jgi:hypothetical protein